MQNYQLSKELNPNAKKKLSINQTHETKIGSLETT